MPRYARIELLVYVSFWLLITSFAVVSSWNLEQVRAQVIYHKSEEIREVSRNRILMENGTLIPVGDIYKEAFQSYLDSKFLGK